MVIAVKERTAVVMAITCGYTRKEEVKRNEYTHSLPWDSLDMILKVYFRGAQ